VDFRFKNFDKHSCKFTLNNKSEKEDFAIPKNWHHFSIETRIANSSKIDIRFYEFMNMIKINCYVLSLLMDKDKLLKIILNKMSVFVKY